MSNRLSHIFFATLLCSLNFPSLLSASSVFLPDAEDGLGFNLNNITDNHETASGNCSGYPFFTCPVHAKCSVCMFGGKYKIIGCDTDYKQSGNACIAKTCAEINASYKAEVPTNQICTITNTSVHTCYSSCRSVNTSGYPLDTCPSGAVCATAPECGSTSTTKGNCSPIKQKVTGCSSSTQKPNSAATTCIDKDDTCPSNYFKSCETGTLGEPKYTEHGSACYQCKPKVLPPTNGDILYSDMTTSSEIILEKTPIAIIFDKTARLALALEDASAFYIFGGYNTDIPNINDCQPENILNCETDGKKNTLEIINFMKNAQKNQADSYAAKGYPPAEYCYNYIPQECSKAECGKGNWFLPSIYQLNLIYNQKNIINNQLSKLGKKNLYEDFMFDSGYWSSNEAYTQSIPGYAQWGLNMKNGQTNYIKKYSSESLSESHPSPGYGYLAVRPLLQY